MKIKKCVPISLEGWEFGDVGEDALKEYLLGLVERYLNEVVFSDDGLDLGISFPMLWPGAGAKTFNPFKTYFSREHVAEAIALHERFPDLSPLSIVLTHSDSQTSILGVFDLGDEVRDWLDEINAETAGPLTRLADALDSLSAEIRAALSKAGKS